MTKFILPALCVSALLLSSCGRMGAPSPKAISESKMDYDKVQSMNQGYVGNTAKESAPPKSSPTMLLAYRYHFNFSIPSKNLEDVSGKALSACKEAGMDKCRIVSSSINKQSEDYVTANIQLRVDPKWFEAYQETLKADSKGGGGKLVGSNVSSEDLTISISDSGAKLGALKTLRSRLLTLLETKGAGVKDLVEVERELARVQGQIEAATARLRVLKTRVSMSEVHLRYETKAVAASRSSFSSLKYALNNFVETVANGLASVIYFIAFILPWLIIGIPVLWLLRKLWRRRKTKKQKA